MNALYEEFKGRGLGLLLVNLGEDPELVRQTVKKRGYTAPVLLDVNRQASAAYLVTGTPTVYLIDRRSQIIRRAIGRRDWAGKDGRRLLAALLRP
jgi:cytochrome c biogenesis protein CcmG/thiol:disulfide interchange protein DsbE